MVSKHHKTIRWLLILKVFSKFGCGGLGTVDGAVLSNYSDYCFNK